MNIGGKTSYNLVSTAVECSESANCVEKRIVLSQPVVIFTQTVGATTRRDWEIFDWNQCDWKHDWRRKELVNNVIAGPDTEANIISICDNDPGCGGYFPIIPDTEGTYVAVNGFENQIVEDRTESYRLVGLEAECTGPLDMVIHEKTFGKPDLNRDSVTEERCRQYATSLGKQYDGLLQQFAKGLRVKQR